MVSELFQVPLRQYGSRAKPSAMILRRTAVGPHPARSVRGKSSATSDAASQILKDYQSATEQYALIVRYLSAAVEVLTEPENQALLEFAEIAKDHCERLHGKLKQVGKHGGKGLTNSQPSVQ